MRVVIAGDYPENPPNLLGGIQAVIYNTLCHLGNYADLELHVVTCEKWRSQLLARPQTVQHGRWTVHYLPSSPRVPHTVSMLTVDRRAVRRQIEALSPDLIHAHGQAAAYPFAAFDAGRPTLLTVHGINMLEARIDPRGGALKGGLRLALWTWAEKACLRRATNIVVISPFVEEVIAPYTRARLHPVNNPVHDDLFSIEPSPEPGKVLLVGSIQKRKGILEAIEVISLVRREAPHARLYVAGGFLPAYREYGQAVQRRLAETGADEYVHLLGNLSHSMLREAYRTSQVLLFPSYLEASSVAVAEAMAAGLPSVVSDIGGTRHLVTDGVEGYRAPPGDVAGLARWIVHLLSYPAAARQMGQAARERARACASAKVAAQNTRDLYLLAGGAS